jgi:glycosyltransferase involved in cell wall biosynthesis
MPLFSVIIPTYNRLAFLPRTLDSVWVQSFTDFELIVVDDGSTDGTREWLAAHAAQALVLTQANRGPGGARNLGASHARGQYLAFLDSDDTWFPWTLATYKEAVARSKTPSFIAGRQAASSEFTMTEPWQYKTRQYPDYLSTASERIWIPTCAAVIRTSAFLRVGGFIEGLRAAEDSDLWLRLGEAPGFIHIIDPPVFRYQRHPRGDSLVGQCTESPGAIETLIAQEKAGDYPGGSIRMRERRRIIGQHARPYIVALLRRGHLKHAFRMYSTMFAWLLRDRRLKFLLGFWLVFIQKALTLHIKRERP